MRAPLIAFLAVLSLPPAQAAPPEEERHAGRNCPRLLAIVGEGVARGRPDRVEVALEVATHDPDPGRARRLADERVARFLAALEQLGVARDDVTAASVRLAPLYEWRDRERVFAGYEARRGVRVGLGDLERLDALLAAATDAGIDRVLAIHYASSRQRALEEEARRRAVADSLEKARTLAAAYGARLGAVRRIDYRETGAPRPLAELAAARADGPGQSYLPDEVEVRERVAVEFDLLPRSVP